MVKPETLQPLILVADDVPKNVQLIGSILDEYAYRVAVAMDGEQAVASASRLHPDLILLDVMMPILDGFEACRRMKQDPALADTPVIFLTAKVTQEEKLAGFAAGGVDYITKPFQIAEVLARIRTHLELKQARDTIRRHKEDLEIMLAERTEELIVSERHAAFSRLVQGIVHNLRGPLTGIRGNADLARIHVQQFGSRLETNPAVSTEELQAFLQNIEQTVEHLLLGSVRIEAMISSLLQKSRTDHSDAIEVIDLNRLVAQELDFLSADQRFKHEVVKDVTLCDRPLPVQVIPGEVTQVFQNLIRNALDAMFGQEHATLRIETLVAGEQALLTIADNGPGISKENLPFLFDPFFTTKRKTVVDESDEPVGTGLGLYTCREIIARHHGRIEAAGTAGQGAQFTIYLPLNRS